MKKLKKVFAVLLSVAMILGMSSTVFAEGESHPGVSVNTKQCQNKDTDKGTITITNLEPKVQVDLYKIASAVYGDANTAGGFKTFEWTDAVKKAPMPTEDGNSTVETDLQTKFETGPNATEVTAVRQALTESMKVTSASKNIGDLTEYSADVPVGVYIAVITGGERVYNPVLLAVSYGVQKDANGKVTGVVLNGGAIDADTAKYSYGTDALAKSTTITFQKGMEGYTPDSEIEEAYKDIYVLDENGNKTGATASIGQVLTYKLKATVPSYPKNAKNKTFFMSDTMDSGLTFDYSSLNVEIAGQDISKNGNNFMLGEKIIATAAQTENGFNLKFNYDNLVINETGATYTPIVSYKAVINENAIVGKDGNKNDAYLYYANEPNKGQTWDTPEHTPDKAEGVTEKHDEKIVYTYQLAFKKVDQKDENKVLAGAIFGIYKEGVAGTGTEKGSVVEASLVDEVTTDAQGYGISWNVGAGEYFIKEIKAPEGYSVNETVYKVTANWKTVTSKVTTNSTTQKYVTVEQAPEGAKQVGWIKAGVYYAALPEGITAETAEDKGYQAAYVKSTTASSTTTTVTKDNGNGAGAVELSAPIPNTDLASLPSTGGIGTIIFTVGGCLIMVVAAALYFANRRKAANSESK